MLAPGPSRPLPALSGPAVGPIQALRDLAGAVLPGANHLDDPGFFAHMDPATPWITWVTAQWAARLNQNLLHPDTGSLARELEERVIAVLAPVWGMAGGHLAPGSTVANLTALWAARDLRRVRTVVASQAAHLSVAKAAHILGLGHQTVATDDEGRLDLTSFTGDLSTAALVLTAGTTSNGAVDPLGAVTTVPPPAWVHVDAAWAGPLRLSARWRSRLDGIEHADSVAVSAHKWLHQPKESALVFFADNRAANEVLSFGGAYLTTPNVGLLGSHGYAALGLAATIHAYGLDGVGTWVDHGMSLATELSERIEAHPDLEQRNPPGPGTGVVLWRHKRTDSRTLQANLDGAFVSIVAIEGEDWLRSVAANPRAEPERVVAAVLAAAGVSSPGG